MSPKQVTNAKPIPHIPLPFEEVMKDVLKVKPPEKAKRKSTERAKRAKQ
jgi:hypothetical protein